MLVHGEQGSQTGYIMARARGKSLDAWPWPATLPMADVLGRVVLAMKQAWQAGVFPMVEHAGNIMVDIGKKGKLAVTLIDTDTSIPLVGEHREDDVIRQLEIIFLNFDGNSFHSEVFVAEKVCSSFTTLDSIFSTASAGQSLCDSGGRSIQQMLRLRSKLRAVETGHAQG